MDWVVNPGSQDLSEPEPEELKKRGRFSRYCCCCCRTCRGQPDNRNNASCCEAGCFQFCCKAAGGEGTGWFSSVVRMVCRCCTCCKKDEKLEMERRKSIAAVLNKRKSRSNTGAPKLDASLVEHGSLMRGAIPVLPVPLAWICLFLNILVPGLGTFSSGCFCLCVGKARFSASDRPENRLGAFCVDLLVGLSQFFTIMFCLVGWGWSIWWGTIMVKLAKKHKRLVKRALEEKPDPAAVPPETVRSPPRSQGGTAEARG